MREQPGSMWSHPARRACAAAAALLVVVMLAHGPANAASSTTVVAATVPSATNLASTSCESSVAGVTHFGTVLPGSTAITGSDCTLTWGSSNDSSMLRVYQADTVGAAMFRSTRGTLDSSFDTDGIQSFDDPDPQVSYEFGEAVAVSPDGSVVTTGRCFHAVTNDDLCTQRFTPAGALDPTFDGDGIQRTAVAPGFAEDFSWAVLVQPDGKTVVAGECYMGAATRKDFCVVRYTTTGALDPSFDGDGMQAVPVGAGTIYDYPAAAALQSDGGIVLAGECETAAFVYDSCLARFASSGALDTSFSADGTVITPAAPAGGNDSINDVALQPDGKIVTAGECAMGAVTGTDVCLMRYLADGTLDTSFDTDGIVTTAIGPGTGLDTAAAVRVQDDGRIVVAGNCNMGATAADFCAARYLTNGSLDTSFDGDGIATTAVAPGAAADTLGGLIVQPDGSILLGGGCAMGGATGTDTCLVRYQPSGALDPTFDGDGILTQAVSSGALADRFSHLAARPDGALVGVGACDVGGGSDVCLSSYAGGGTIGQYVDGSVDWDQGASMFGSCLRAVTNATAVWNAAGACTVVDGSNWNAVPTGATQVATAAPNVANATVQLRFGMRAATSQAPGTYVAPIAFEVLAPSV